jgi:dTMP kinase
VALFTVIEGADCCGKTTQVKLLVEKLEQMRLGAVEMSFPRYETPVGRIIKLNLEGELRLRDACGGLVEDDEDLMFQALNTMDKYEASDDILEHLRCDRNVVSSRWWQSAVVYGNDMGIPRESLLKIHRLLPRADLNVLIWLPEEESIARRPDMRDRLERDRERQKHMREAYRQMWAEHKAVLSIPGLHRGRDDSANWWLVVDGRGSEMEVHEKIWNTFLWILQDKGAYFQGSCGAGLTT